MTLLIAAFAAAPLQAQTAPAPHLRGDPNHWSFHAPQAPRPPEVKQSNWLKNPIDQFILTELESRGLSPSPAATKRALLRRVTLDLTGLLPTPDESDNFVNDPAPDAYEKVVDRLLSSPRFGEHRAHYWLDYVRYGDTHGLHNDDYRDIWPYRDYIVRSFNQNKPFDQFAVEQIAGDLLPPTNIDQLLATGFLRCNLSTGEGGAINEEIRVNNARDRTEAYGSVFLGLTVGCAVCHDHKFDPITQKDFYALSAFFNNLEARPSNDDRFEPPPAVRIPRPGRLHAYNAVLSQKAQILAQIQQRERKGDELVEAWIAAGNRPRQVSTDGLRLRLRFDEQHGVEVTNSAPGAIPKACAFAGVPPVWGEETWLWPSLRLEAATTLSLPDVGDFEADQSFSAGGWVQVRNNPTSIGDVSTGAILSRLDSAHASRGWDLLMEKDAPTVHLVNTWPTNVIKVQSTTKLSRGQWHHIFFTCDGSARAAGVKIFADGKELPTKALNDTLTDSIRTSVPWELGRRHDSDALKLARFQDIRVYDRPLAPEEVARLPFEDYAAEISQHPAQQWNEDQRFVLRDFYLRNIDKNMQRLRAQLKPLDAQLDKLSEGGEFCMIAQERPQLAYANVLTRGIYTARKQRVRPDVPQFLPHLPDGAPRDRLALARWTVSAENPLFARVTVNRMWQELFGTGLVETTGDFGMMGKAPSNPQLLDWLAIEFRQSGWDTKHMYRLMVTSATYRQSARITPDLQERDPQNRLLARGPRFRMDVEMLRDSALQAAGLLVEQIGGPSVKPYQPPGIWEAVRGLATKPQEWVQDKGDGTYRRTLYTFWKRQAPPPDLLTWDAPLRDVSCTRRERTNTPLQALVLWNDPQWFEASRVLAERAIKSRDSREARLDFIARWVLSRPLESDEARIFLDALARFDQRYRDDPKAAAELLAVGDRRVDPTLPPAEVAAWTLVASQILSTDEALNK